LNLDSVPVDTTLLKTEANPDSNYGNLSYFISNIGAIIVEMVVDHSVSEICEVKNHYSNIDLLLGKSESRHYGTGYKESLIKIKNVDIDSDESKISAQINLSYPAVQNRLYHDIGSSHSPCVSQVDVIVSLAQLAQALLYKLDTIDREHSNNLWMRKIEFVNPKPAFLPEDFTVTTWISKTNTILMNGKKWRTAKFGTSFPSIEVDYSVAHQLP
jgi:hypothetical protein